MTRKLQRSNRGDTIIEVLIVLAVLSLSFTISLATATHGLGQARNSEEHSAADGVLQGQLEDLRGAVSSQNTAVFAALDDPTSSSYASSFCMDSSGQPTATFPVPASNGGESNLSEYVKTSGPNQYNCTSGFYNESITYLKGDSDTQNYFELRVRWPGTGSLGMQEVSFLYKVNALTANALSGVTTTSSQPQINVDVNEYYNPSAVQTSPFWSGCGGPSHLASSDNGTQVKLHDFEPSGNSTDLTAGTTGGKANFTLNGATDFHTYNATLTGAPIIGDARSQACSSTSNTAQIVPNQPTPELTGITVQQYCDDAHPVSIPIYGEVAYWHTVTVLVGYAWNHDGPIVNSPFNPTQVQPQVASPYNPNTMGGNFPPYWNTPTTFPETGYEWVQNNYRRNSDPNNYASYASFNYNTYHSVQQFGQVQEFYADPPGTIGPGYQIVGYNNFTNYTCWP